MDWKDIKKKTNKVAIVGFADTKNQAPFNDNTFEIWGLNSLFEQIPRWDRWFEIHSKKHFKWDTNKEVGLGLTRDGKPYLEALAKMTCPIYMTEQDPNIPNSVRYPLEEMIAIFDPKGARAEWQEFKNSKLLDWNGYFTNSVSYMIALAIYENFEEIHIYGVDMATATEYGSQRPSCEYYIGFAVGKGIKVYIPNEADLLKTRFLYGFEEERTVAFDAKLLKIINSMVGRMQEAQRVHDHAQKQIDQYIGAIEGIKEMKKVWGEC